MAKKNPRVIAVLLTGAALILPGGCSSDDGPTTGTSTPTSQNPSASATRSTTKEDRAAAEATETVLAYRQTVIDLFSGARTNLNDLNDVATGARLDQALIDTQQSLVKGWKAEKGAEVILASSRPIKVDLDADPPTVRVRACVDLTGVTFTKPDGTKAQGTRGQSDYILVKTEHLPAPGWAVQKIVVLEKDSC